MRHGSPDLAHYSEAVEYYSTAHTQALVSDDYAARAEALRGLLAQGGAALPYALSLLGHVTYDGRPDGASILGEVGASGPSGETIVTALVAAIGRELQHLEGKNGHELEALDTMVSALGHLGSAQALPILSTLVNDQAAQDGDTQWTAIEALSRISDHLLLNEEDPVTAARQWLSDQGYTV